jgi:hypothetical protein
MFLIINIYTYCVKLSKNNYTKLKTKIEDVITASEHAEISRGKAEDTTEKLKQKGGNLAASA